MFMNLNFNNGEPNIWFSIDNFISIVALLFSGISLFITYRINKKNNKVQTMKGLYDRIFFDNFIFQCNEKIISIPIKDSSLNKFKFDEHQLEEILDLTVKLRMNILFFKYTNPVFHKKLIKEIHGIEDLIIEKCFYENSREKIEERLFSLTEKFGSLTKVIMDEYIG